MDLGTAALLTAVLMPSDLSARLGDTGWGHGQAHPGSALGLGWRNATACRNHRGAKPGKRRAVGVVAAMARWDTALGWQLKQPQPWDRNHSGHAVRDQNWPHFSAVL